MIQNKSSRVVRQFPQKSPTVEFKFFADTVIQKFDRGNFDELDEWIMIYVSKLYLPTLFS